MVSLIMVFLMGHGSAEAAFKAGAAVKSLNAPMGISLAGFGGGGRRNWGLPEGPYANYLKASTGVHDDPSARALVIQRGGKKVALVSVDLIASSIVIRQKLGKRLVDLGFEEKDIFLTATHTHSGPSSFAHLGMWQIIAADKFAPEILDLFTDAVESAIREADKKLVPAKLGVGVGPLRGVVRNRRSDLPIDPPVTLVRIGDFQNQTLATVINFPIHGTFMDSHNLVLSADIPGAIMRHFEKKAGGVAIFINGSEGDVSPIRDRSDFVEMEAKGQSITDLIYNYWQRIRQGDLLRLETFEYRQPLGKPKLNLTACAFNGSPLSAIMTLPQDLPNEAIMSGLAINNIVFVGIPGEATMAVGQSIRDAGKALGFTFTSIFGLANDHLSYILTEQEYRQGGYEACSSLYGPDLGAKIQTGASEILLGLISTN